MNWKIMKKVFLHIGLHKTGSTSLQAFLHRNRNTLRDYGYLYPQTGASSRFDCHHNLAWLLTNWSNKADPSLGTWKELHQEIDNTSLNKIIISSEEFEFVGMVHKGIKCLKSELESYEVKIIIYIRRQDKRLESHYINCIKAGFYSGDILSFCEKKRNTYDYYKLIEPWKQTFGIDNIIVRPLERTQIPSIYNDFLKVIGITKHDNFLEVEDQNIRPGIKELEIFKNINKLYNNQQLERKKYLKQINEFLNKHRAGDERSYRLLSYSDSVKILEWYKQSNIKVAQECLGREDGTLFYETVEYYESNDLSLKDFSKEELLRLKQEVTQSGSEDLSKIEEAYLKEGNQLREQGKLAQAIKKYSEILLINPDCVQAYHQLAKIYESRNEFDRAIEHYQRFIQFEPSNSRVLAKLATLMMRQGNIEGAVIAYQKAIVPAQNPKQPDWFYRSVYTGLGEALEKNGQIEEAIAAYQEALEILPDNSHNSIVHAHLGRAMMAQKNTQEAITAYQKAIALQPEQPVWVYVGLGDVLNQNGQIEEAIAAYEKVIECNPRNKKILVNDCLYQLIGKSGLKNALSQYFPSFDNIEGLDMNNKKKYLYCLNVNYPPEQILDLDNLLNRLPSEIKSLLMKGKCYLILDASNEGHQFKEKFGKAFHEIARILNCQRQQIIYLTQNKLYLDFYNNWCHQNNLFIKNRVKIFTLNEALLTIVQKNKEKYPVQNFNFINPRYRKKKFLFLNNIPRAHRIFLLHQMIENNLLNDGLVSFNHKITERYYKHKLRQVKCFLPHIGLDDIDRICQQIDSQYLPLRIDLVNRDNLRPDGRGSYIREIPLELYSNTYFSIISESNFSNGDRVKRFTEKSLKPFLGLHPFLIAGEPGTLTVLRDIGFKTFNGYIDESYDLVEDPYERANLIVEQLKNLCSMSQEELHNWYTELSPILFYNYGHFINRMPIWCKRDLSKKLEMISSD